MPSGATLAVFAAAALALAVVPGPAVLYIVAQSIESGRLGGLVSALGVATGGLVHVVAATVGISALIASSAVAFTAVKLVGAAYLVALGVHTLVVRREPERESVRPLRRLRRRYARGVVVNVLNPKTALFFLAFLPQFADPARGSVTTQLLVLGLVFVAVAVCSDAVWALGAGTASARLRTSARFLGVQRWVSGSVFVGLGALTALARRH